VSFVRRNRVVIVSVALLLASILLLSKNTRTLAADPVASAVLQVMRPLQVAASAAVDAAGEIWTGYIALVGVRSENERLQNRVAELEQQLIRTAELRAMERRLDQLLAFGAAFQLRAEAALVIGRDPLPWSGTVTINKGLRDGIVEDAAVVARAGVVGRTIATSAHSARVQLITDHNSGVDALVQRSRARGIVKGGVDGRLVMKYIDREESVVVGDLIVTSGLSGIFPKGIAVGEVVRVWKDSRGLMQEAEVVPVVPLNRIEEVLVVRRPPAPSAPFSPAGDGLGLPSVGAPAGGADG
jgi:rod shape-determining protein MreC